MPEKTKRENEVETPPRKEPVDPEPDDRDLDPDSSWAQDQRRRDYYYDDSHGYRVYRPEEDEDE